VRGTTQVREFRALAHEQFGPQSDANHFRGAEESRLPRTHLLPPANGYLSPRGRWRWPHLPQPSEGVCQASRSELVGHQYLQRPVQFPYQREPCRQHKRHRKDHLIPPHFPRPLSRPVRTSSFRPLHAKAPEKEPHRPQQRCRF